MMVKIPINSYITPWKFNIAPEDIENIPSQKLFQPSFFRGELFNFRGVRLPKGETTKGRRGFLTWELLDFVSGEP